MMQWTAETLVATTILMLLVLAVRPFVASRFGARAAYLLWFAPALRMILPPIPAEWIGVREAVVQDAVVVLVGSSSPSLQPATAAGGSTAWLIVPLAIWLGGAALFFGRHLLNYIRFSRDVAEGGRALFDAGNIPVTASAVVSSPIALGVFGKSVIVPADFEHRFDAEEQRLAVAHELTHHGRHDVPVNFFALAMLALHWWNPIAHVAHRAFRLDQEAACDAIVLDGASAAERHAYGSALFKSAMGRVPLAACAMGATTTLKARLRRIIANPTDSRWAKPGSALAAILVTTGVAVTASGGVPDMVEPVIEAPRELVLGGGLINVNALIPAASASSHVGHNAGSCPEEARAKAQKAQGKAMKMAARARTEALAEAAEARAEALAASGEAREEALKAAAEARAEAQAAVLEAQDEIRAAHAEAAVAWRRAAGPVAMAKATKAAAINCAGSSNGRAISFAMSGATVGRQDMRIVVCVPDGAQQKAYVIKALRTTRADIERDPNITAEMRVQVLGALDRQIQSLKPVEPLSLQ